MSQYPTLPFTDPDVIASNRQGIITPEQQEILLFYVSWPFWGCLVWFILTGLILFPFWWPGSEQLPAFMMPLYVLIFGGGAVLTTAMFGWQIWKGLRQRQEIKRGPVVWADGEVIVRGERFEVLIPDGRLQSPVQKFNLLPGPYRFYFLPRSRFLLSAESIEQNAADLVANALNIPRLPADLTRALPALMQTFRFNEADLAQNRAGGLTNRQRGRTFLDILLYLGMLLAVTFFAGLVVAGYWFGWTEPEIPDSWLFQVWQFVCLGGIVLFAFGYPLWNIATRLIDILSGQVSTLSGPIQFKIRGGRSSTSYYVIQGQEFQVKHTAYHSFIEKLPYHVYYIPRTKEIVSLEPVEGRY